ncbi:MAG TPA: ADOP family duplicated permease [Vicinamibacteria bacterium]|nr:ADOP family duplicated permease [Vicinamibacteria bacterium]
MKRLRAWLARLAGTWPSARRERELADEIESHLQMHVEDNLRAGMSPREARRAALVKLGGVEQTKEACRDQAGLPFVEHALQDARFACRQLARSPGFALVAVAVLALGTGASTAIFAFVDAALFQPLPYREPHRLVSVTESIAGLLPRTALSHLDYVDWKERNRTLESLDVFAGDGHLLSTAAGVAPVSGTRVTAGFFRTLGVSPALGRDFHPGEDAPGGPAVAILSHGTWLRRFGGDPATVGRTAVLSDVPHTIIGVLPPHFEFAPRGRAELWTLVRGTSNCERRRSCHNLEGVGRLKRGVSIAAADLEMKAIAADLERQYPDSNRGQGASVISLTEAVVAEVRPILLLLLGGAILLLVIAIVNVASLLLVRSEGRRLETSVRRALGASRGRLVRQSLTEGLVLVAAAGAAGAAIAAGAMRLLVSLIPADLLARMPFVHRLGLGGHALAFLAAVSVLAAVLLALLPATRSPGSDVRDGLAANARASAGLSWRRFASKLVAAELAVAVVLLVGAGLLGRSLERLLSVPVGFEPDHLATMEVAAPETRYDTPEQCVALVREVVRRVGGVPGVESVAVTSLLPVTFNGNTDWIRFVGRPYDGEHNEVNQREVGAEYFRTLRARLLRGRSFTDAEDATKPLVVVINRTLARRYFPNEDPIGKQMGDTSLSPGSIKEIIGVVDDIREGPLNAEIWPAVYYPFHQDAGSFFRLVARTSQDERSALPAIAAEIRRVDPDLGVIDETTMRDRIADSPVAYLQRSSAWLIGGFAAVALLLALVGLSGLVAYSVSQRSREIGLRMALGAERRGVYRLVLGEAGRLAALGVAAGMAAATAAAASLRRVLFETPPFDAVTLATVAATVGAAALLASYVPARRAASVDPVIALRSE